MVQIRYKTVCILLLGTAAMSLVHFCFSSQKVQKHIEKGKERAALLRNATTTTTATTTATNHFLTYEWDDGCMAPPEPVSMAEIRKAPPTGIAITLAKATKQSARDYLKIVCNKIPTQQAFLFEPHGIDFLLLLAMEGVSMSRVAQCLNLTRIPDGAVEWTNLDGSVLWTHEYRSKTGRGRVFLAPYVMPYPDYIQRDMSLLTEPIDCGADHDYVQGTRFYSHEGLNLKIASDYEYMLKVDTDIEFNATLPFHLLSDMKRKGKVFGHTAAFARGLNACTKGFQEVKDTFVQTFGSTTKANKASWAKEWGTPCSAGVVEFERPWDLWYTNFIVYRTDFFMSEPVRAFGRWMNEFHPGYFRHRWGDQLFFHHAMGMFLPDFLEYVEDYTDLRCYLYENCWWFWAPNTNHDNFCQNGGYFYHIKTANYLGPFDGEFPDVIAPMPEDPYVGTYQDNCHGLFG